MSVTNGQSANATVFNAAFVSKTANSTTIGQVALANADSSSGATISNIQRELNSFSSFTGKAINTSKTDLPVWVDNSIGASSDSLFDRIEAVQANFPTLVADRLLYGNYQQSSDLVYLSPSGYFGVGTSTPSGNFDVDGSICVTSANVTLASGEIDYVENSFVRIDSLSVPDLSTVPAPAGNGNQLKLIANVSGFDIDLDGSGNIDTNGSTIVFADTTLILLAWDRIDSKWRILAGGSGGSSVVINNFDETDFIITCLNTQEQIWRFTGGGAVAPITLSSIDFSAVPQGGKVTITSQEDSAYPVTIIPTLTNIIMNGEWVGTQYSTIQYQRIGARLIEVSRNGI